MAAYLIPQPQQFFDNNGDPLAGGLVYTCSAGASGITSEYLKDSYTDALGTTLNSNPVVLDSSGRANIWGDGLPYKLFIYTASMALVESVDNLSPILGVAPNITVDSISSLGNLADNADFQIWTRGDSVTVADSGAGICADRYRIANFSGVTATMAKSTMQIDGVARACGSVSLSAVVATYASGKYVIPFMQVFEGRSVYRYLSPGKSFAVAVAVEVSVAGKYAFAVRNADYSFSYVHTAMLAANTPTIVQFTVPIPTTGGLWNCPNTAARGLDLLIGAVGEGQIAAPSTDGWLSGNYYTTADCVNWTATAGATIKITRVRLMSGDILGEYVPNDYQTDLMRCQYFLPAVPRGIIGSCAWNSATSGVITVPFKVATRATPTGLLVQAGLSLQSDPYVVSGLSFNSATSNQAGFVLVTGSGAALGASSVVYTTGSGSILFTGAEL